MIDDNKSDERYQSFKSDIGNIENKFGERDQIYRINDKKYDERYQIGEKQGNEIELEESETDKRYQIKMHKNLIG